MYIAIISCVQCSLFVLGKYIPHDSLRELPDMMSTKFSDFLTPSPLSIFGSDLYCKIHATSLTMLAFP